MERLKEMFGRGEITQEEFDDGMDQYSVGWYKTSYEAQELVRQFTFFRTRFRDLFAREPRSQNPLPYTWPTTASIEANQHLVCLCTPVHHLVRISDVTSRDTQINVKTAISIDNDYLDRWLDRDQRETIVSVFNSCCDLINIKVASMDCGAKREFDNAWARHRDEFVISLTGNSHDVPTFVWFDLIALAWGFEEEDSKLLNKDNGEMVQ
jgi:hypothetical protein